MDTMQKPDSVEITVKCYAATYIATARGLKVRASCTGGSYEAAHSCAYKIYGYGPDNQDAFTLEKKSDSAYVATIKR